MSQLRSSLSEFRSFLERIVGDVREPTPGESFFDSAMWFSNNDLGGFSLDRAEAQELGACVESIARNMGDNATKDYVSNLSKYAIIAALDPRQLKPHKTPAQRVDDAMREFREKLEAPARELTECIGVDGMFPPNEAIHFPNVVFITNKHSIFEEFRAEVSKIIGSTLSPEPDREAHLRYFEEAIANIKSPAIALVTVTATESQAGHAKAEILLRRRLDQLNYLISVTGREKSYQGLTLATETPARNRCLISKSREPDTLNLDHCIGRFAWPVDIEKMLSPVDSTSLHDNFIKLLRTVAPSAHQKRMLTSIGWAGRSTTAAREEERFTYLAIAWESLMLSRTESEISNRLCTSTVNLLTPFLKYPLKCFKDLKLLYGIRSKIVHSGTYEVSPFDTARLGQYFQLCIKKLLTDPTLLSFSGSEDLEHWCFRRSIGISVSDAAV